jgi:hypothetical protein
MSGEGVIATFFYRLADLRGLGPRAVIPPAVNVSLEVFEAMHRSFTWGQWRAIEFVSGFSKRMDGRLSRPRRRPWDDVLTPGAADRPGAGPVLPPAGLDSTLCNDQS